MLAACVCVCLCVCVCMRACVRVHVFNVDILLVKVARVK